MSVVRAEGTVRDVAMPKVSADGKGATIETGEILLLPGELWGAIDTAIEAARALPNATAEQARTAFAGVFAEALHRAGLILVKTADPKSTQTVSVQTYSQALEGKHTVESKVENLRQLIMGWPSDLGRAPLLWDLAQGVLAITGRAPPADRQRLHVALLRVRALTAIAMGQPTDGWDINQAPEFPEPLAAFFRGDDI